MENQLPFMNHAPLVNAFSRRRFLRQLGIATGAASVIGTALNPGRLMAETSPNPKTIIIIGAGMSGLCAAYELEKRGHKVTILEANTSRIGGRVFTHRFADGHHGEFGALRVPAGHNLTRHYASVLGVQLRPFVQSNPEAYYY